MWVCRVEGMEAQTLARPIGVTVVNVGQDCGPGWDFLLKSLGNRRKHIFSTGIVKQIRGTSGLVCCRKNLIGSDGVRPTQRPAEWRTRTVTRS